MNRMIGLMLSILALPVAAQDNLCADLVPIHTPKPEYPTYEQAREKDYFSGTSYTHVFIEGFVKARFIVQPSGVVESVEIIDSENRPKKHTDKSFGGFLEMNVLSTLKNWRYEIISMPCIQEEVFHYELKTD